MDSERVIAVRSPYLARPGRRAIVMLDLADLHGPTTGAVALPVWLYWSSPDHRFDLSDHDMRIWLYQTVLREASSADDLMTYLDGGMLVELWPELHLPKGLRQAWEEMHPVLTGIAVS